MKKIANLAAVLAIFINSIGGILYELPDAFGQEATLTDSQGQEGEGDEENSEDDNGEEEDFTPPRSTFTSPQEGSFWGTEGVEIAGFSTDVPNTTVDYVTLWASFTGEEDWFEIDQIENEEEDQPFHWSFTWFPEEEGIYDIMAEATDIAGNTESSPVVENITYDVTPPTPPVTDPASGDYPFDQSVILLSSDNLSGVAKIFYTNDGADPSSQNGILYDGAITVDRDMTIKAIAYDKAGNASDVSTADFGIPPIISDETTSSVSASTVTITWTTDDPATSRVIYDSVSHPELGQGPNYGYANSTSEGDTDPKVTSHSVTVGALTAGTTFYYRTVSRGSPEAVSGENIFTTAGSKSSSGPSFSAPGSASAPGCGDARPGSAPTLLTAAAATNEVILTWLGAQDPVTYYLVTYGTAPGTQSFGNPNVGGKGTASYTVKGLSGGTTYYFRVRAGNGCAPGAFSNEISATPGGGSVVGPAVGFTTGVLGKNVPEATQSAQVSPQAGANPSALGAKTDVKETRNWLMILIIIGISAGVAIAFLLFWKNQKKLKIS